jgi:hypothetical protein
MSVTYLEIPGPIEPDQPMPNPPGEPEIPDPAPPPPEPEPAIPAQQAAFG